MVNRPAAAGCNSEPSAVKQLPGAPLLVTWYGLRAVCCPEDKALMAQQLKVQVGGTLWQLHCQLPLPVRIAAAV